MKKFSEEGGVSVCLCLLSSGRFEHLGFRRRGGMNSVSCHRGDAIAFLLHATVAIE